MFIDLIRVLENEWYKRNIPSDLVTRDIRLSLNDMIIKPRKIIAVVGLRRVGKTYLAYQIAREAIRKYGLEKTFFINFEDERIPEREEFLTELYSHLEEKGEETFIFLDEVQRMPQWSRWLRRLYDTLKPPILITGSSSKLTEDELPSELRGRTLTFRLFPLTFREFLKFKGQNLEDIKYEESKMKSYFQEFLYYGGLPEVVLSPEFRKLNILQDYFSTIIQRDIVERHKIKKVVEVKKFLKLMANTTIFSASKTRNVMRSMGFSLSKATIIEYLEYAKESFFLYTVPALTDKMKEAEVLPKKLYMGDWGFITALSFTRVKLGRLLENLVFIELMRRTYRDKRYDIRYWFGREGEVDFVVRYGFDIVDAIQVCYDPMDIETRIREETALLSLLRKVNLKVGKIITAFYDAEEKRGSYTLKYIPYWKWEIENMTKN